MSVEMRHLELLMAVVEEGTLTKAADRLHLTQSALSHQLRDVEDRLGTPLFRRIGKKMLLTQAGERLLSTARAVKNELERARGDIQRMTDGDSGILRISTECYTCYNWLPPLLKTFSRKFPDVDVKIVVEATHHPIQALLKGKLDLAIVCSEPSNELKLQFAPLFEDELVTIMRRDHPLSRRRYVEAQDFAREHLLVYDLPDEDIGVFQKVLIPAGVTPRKVSRVQLTEAIIEMVRGGFGIAVLAKWIVEPFLKSGGLVALPITRKGVHRQWKAVMMNDGSIPKYMQEFVKLFVKNPVASRKGSRTRQRGHVPIPAAERGTSRQKSGTLPPAVTHRN
jgi:LysR family transcriptional regulator for metE and metH